MVVKIASKLSLKVSQVEKAVELLEAGNTVPFIARYRREATGLAATGRADVGSGDNTRLT